MSLLLAGIGACSSSSGEGPGGGNSTDAAKDGALPPADGPFACGTTTCSATQYCVQECACGGLPACNPVSDAGTCPAGQQLQGKCCIQICTNPPPACQDMPTCGGSSSSRNVQCPCPG